MPSLDESGKQRDQLTELRAMFRNAAGAPGLYHAIRIPIESGSANRADTEEDWDEFLGDEHPFEHTRYWTPGEPDGCFFGEKTKLKDFSGLAAAAFGFAPTSIFRMLSADRRVRIDRDGWLLGLFHLGFLSANVLLDFEGDGTYRTLSIGDHARDLVCRVFFQPDTHHNSISEWCDTQRKLASPVPQYLYVALAHDVFASSASGIDFILDNWEQLFDTVVPLDIANVLEAHEADSSESEKERRSPDGDPPPSSEAHQDRRLEITVVPPRVTLDGTIYHVTEEAATVLKAIQDGGGRDVSFPSMLEKYPILQGQRLHRIKKKMPPDLSAIITSGTGKGSVLDLA